MKLVFRTAFELSLQHDFYTDSVCRDFSLFPVSDTKELLRNHQAIFSFKESSGTFLLKEDKTGTTAANPVSDSEVIVLGMKLQNPVLSNYTNEWPSAKKIFLFTNKGNLTDPALSPVELIRSEISLSGKYLAHPIVTADAVTITIKDENDTLIESVKLDASPDEREQTFDLQKYPNGIYTVTETTGGGSTDYVYYADNELLFKGIFGLVRIINQITFPFLYDGKTKFRISFTAKSSVWKYYVVAPNMSGADLLNNLTIADAERVPPDEIVFTKTYPVLPGDKTAPLLYSDTNKVALFTSDDPLVFMQQPRKKIELKKGATVLLGNLPNPDVKKPTTEIFIYV